MKKVISDHREIAIIELQSTVNPSSTVSTEQLTLNLCCHVFFCLAPPELKNPTAILRISPPFLKQDFQSDNLVFGFLLSNLSVRYE